MKDFLLEDWRRIYIEEELRQNGFTSDPNDLIKLVVEEVGYALFAPVHEGKRPTYGALVSAGTERLACLIKESYSAEFKPCSIDSRYCADGVSSFFLHAKSDCKLFWCGKGVAFRDEAALFLLRDNMVFSNPSRSPQKMPARADPDLVLVHRNESGTVTVMHWNGITQYSNGLWSFKAYQYNLFLEETLSMRDVDFDSDCQDVLRSILSMCVNILSPAGCGATIIMRLNKDKELHKFLNPANARRGLPQLSIRFLNYQYALAHILKQCDGAAVISQSGELEQVGIWLAPDIALLRKIQSVGGSRQLTAQVTSDLIRSPILTVSSDGPVRAFYRGQLICDSSASELTGIAAFTSKPYHLLKVPSSAAKILDSKQRPKRPRNGRRRASNG